MEHSTFKESLFNVWKAKNVGDFWIRKIFAIFRILRDQLLMEPVTIDTSHLQTMLETVATLRPIIGFDEQEVTKQQNRNG